MAKKQTNPRKKPTPKKPKLAVGGQVEIPMPKTSKCEAYVSLVDVRLTEDAPHKYQVVIEIEHDHGGPVRFSSGQGRTSAALAWTKAFDKAIKEIDHRSATADVPSTKKQLNTAWRTLTNLAKQDWVGSTGNRQALLGPEDQKKHPPKDGGDIPKVLKAAYIELTKLTADWERANNSQKATKERMNEKQSDVNHIISSFISGQGGLFDKDD